jgi:hypothetical protein
VNLPAFAKGGDLMAHFDFEAGRWRNGAARVVYDAQGGALASLSQSGDFTLLRNTFKDEPGYLPIDNTGRPLDIENNPLASYTPAARILARVGEAGWKLVMMINEDDGNLYLAGQLLDEVEGEPTPTGAPEYVVTNHGSPPQPLCIIDNTGNLEIKGEFRYTLKGRGEVLQKYTRFMPPCRCCANGSGVPYDCDCFDYHPWCIQPTECSYSCPEGGCDFAISVAETKSAMPYDEVLLEVFDNGDVAVNGYVYSNGDSMPSGEDTIPLLECENVAFLVVQENGTVGDLWVAGEVIVGLAPEDVSDAGECSHVWRAADETALASVDEYGVLRLTGYLFHGEGPYARAKGFPQVLEYIWPEE